MKKLLPASIALLGATAALAPAAKIDYDPVRPYAAFKYGPSASADYFPIAIWLREPSNACEVSVCGD